MSVKNDFVSIVLVLMVIWMFHIPYSFTPNVVEMYRLDSDIFSFVLIDIVMLTIFIVCLLVFASKKHFDSKWQQYRYYRICATFIANITFIFAWLIGFAVSVGFYCRYYWNIDCAHDLENDACQKFPIEIDIAYLFFTLPMLFMLILALYFAFRHKILSKANCLWLSWLLFFMLISILICFRSNGVGCYD